MQLVEPDGRVSAGAEAVFRSLKRNPWLAWLLTLYTAFPWFARWSEHSYRFVATRRSGFSRVNRWLWGRHPELPRYETTTLLFIRAVALMFLVAFLSLWSQVHGLVGEQGILPAGPFMGAADGYFDQNGVGLGRYVQLPTLGWFAAGDLALHAYCLVGVVAAIAVLAGWLPAASLLVCWVTYLTLVLLGQDFLSFQWDILLLETGFLTVLIAPWHLRLRLLPGARVFGGILLVRWLLFRLMLESGVVKLSSGDLTWRNLTALRFHFETQPLPTWLGWYAHQLPLWLLKSATVVMYGIELVVPFLIFAPRRLRLFACAALVGLQVVIALTGNYGFFNALTLVLCLALLDDRTVESIRAVGRRWFRRGTPRDGLSDGTCNSQSRPAAGDSGASLLQRVRPWLIGSYAVIVVLVGAAQLESSFGSHTTGRGPVSWLRQKAQSFLLVNSYGLFRVMTVERPELIIEGSLDGVEWRAYAFKHKPGALDHAPGMLPLHMPRLDWQMWFAALSEGNAPRWLGGFSEGLFRRSPDVLGLLAADPFPESSPRYLRVLAFRYRFSTTVERRNTGEWWVADSKRYFVPVMRWEPPTTPAPGR